MRRTEYILKSKDVPLIIFDYFTKEGSFVGDCCVDIRKVFVENKQLFPKGLSLYHNIEHLNIELESWLIKRRASVKRKYIRDIFNVISDVVDPLNYIKMSKGLSLNDSFWVVPADDDSTWEKSNFYENNFLDVISDFVLSGKQCKYYDKILEVLGIYKDKQEFDFVASPEFTTDGNLRKCWIKRGKYIYLRKACDADMVMPDGRSPISMEFYLYQVAEAMGLIHVPYTLEKKIYPDGTKETVCDCKLFTSDEIGLVSANAYIKHIEPTMYVAMQSPDKREQLFLHQAIANKIGAEFYSDLMVFDSLVLNNDRHFNNIGVLVDNNTGEVIGTAPIFDSGASMYWSRFGAITEEHVKLYLKYDVQKEGGKFLVFNEQAKAFLNQRHIPMLSRLKDFEFRQPKDPSLGISSETLRVLNFAIQTRSRQLLEMIRS